MMKCFAHHVFVVLLVALPPLLALAVPADPPGRQSQANELPGDQSDGSQGSDQGSSGPGNNSTGQCTCQGNNQGGAGDPGPTQNGVTAQQQLNAVNSWRADTSKVSHFLDTATTFTGQEYKRQAQIALDAELDELIHKKVLDQAVGTQPAVLAASNVLATQGFFQQVVDVLRRMARDGAATARQDVDTINRNRCVNVLPNIDTYFASAGAPQLKAIRPAACAQILAPPAPASGDRKGTGGGGDCSAAQPQPQPQPPAAVAPAPPPAADLAPPPPPSGAGLPQPPAGGPLRKGKGKATKKLNARRVAAAPRPNMRG